LVFAGKQAADDDASQVAERVAELLEWPHASVITQFKLDGSNAVVEREVEGGNLTLSIPLPAIFTAQKGLNKPEYPKLPNIMKAKKKPVDEKTLESLGLSAATLANRVTVESMALPRQERLAKLIDGDAAGQVAELVRILKEDEKAL
jgi:electron transfer flavoprotein beta subunit